MKKINMKTNNEINSSKILEKNVYTRLKNGENITNYLIDYINDKTYKSFRTISKKLKHIINELYESEIIDKNDFYKIQEAISKKLKDKKPEIFINIDKVLKDIVDYLPFSKTNPDYFMNLFFLAMPFLISMKYQEIRSIRYKDIKRYNISNHLILECKFNEDKSLSSLKFNRYNKEWDELFEIYKERNCLEDKIFESLPKTNTHLNFILDKYLRKYLEEGYVGNKYYTFVKNALLYSKNSFVVDL